MLDAAGPWGTGPFILKDGTSTLEKRSPEVVLEANPNYWKASRKPKVQRVVFDNIISRAEALEQVGDPNGKIDIVTELTPAEAAQLARSKAATVVRSDAKTVLVGVFNQNRSDSRWRDVRVRRAVNHAVDRNAVVRVGARGYGTVLPAMIMPGAFGYDAGLKPYAFELAAAKQAIRQARLAGASITIVAAATYKPVVEVIARNLTALGLKVNPVYADAPTGDDWDLWLVEHFDWSPEFPAGVVYREFFGKDGAFRKMPEDEKFNELYAQVLATPDTAQQKQLIRQLDRYVHDQANVLFLYAPAKLYGVRKGVHFVPYKTTMLELAETAVTRAPVKAGSRE